MPLKIPILERFNQKWIPCRRRGCHVWIANVSPKGYGRFVYQGVGRQAHAVAWELRHGPLPVGLGVLHRCDTRWITTGYRRCVNVEHLFIGTNADNTADMVAKGRQRAPRGEQQHNAKLTDEAIRAIRAACADGEAQAVVARRYAVTATLVWMIVRGKIWKHVT